MSTRYEFLEVQEFVKNETDYESVDYYRMQNGDTIALDLRDKPHAILRDHITHGGDQALFNWAAEQGIVRANQEGMISLHDQATAEPLTPYIATHVAMMICFPERYQPFFNGDLVWTEQDERMRELARLTGSTLTCRLHKSTWWGDHEIIDPNAPKGPGRPRKHTPKQEEKQEKSTEGYKAWVQACQDHNERLAHVWAEYMEACTERKRQKAQGEEWLKRQKELIMEEAKRRVAELEGQFNTQMDKLTRDVHDKLALHSEIKSEGKPKREQFMELR